MNATLDGPDPTVIGPPSTVLVSRSTTVTVDPRKKCVTYAVCPSGLTASPTGDPPTSTVARTLPVVASSTFIVVPPPSVT